MAIWCAGLEAFDSWTMPIEMEDQMEFYKVVNQDRSQRMAVKNTLSFMSPVSRKLTVKRNGTGVNKTRKLTLKVSATPLWRAETSREQAPKTPPRSKPLCPGRHGVGGAWHCMEPTSVDGVWHCFECGRRVESI